MIRKRLRAVGGLSHQFDYVAARNPGAAARFVDAVESSLRELEKMPRLGRRLRSDDPRLADVRVRGVGGFANHLLYYRPIEGGIEWLATRHAAQDEPTATELK